MRERQKPPLLHRRILVNELDSVEQTATWERLRSVDHDRSPSGLASRAEAEIVGFLRVAHLLGGEILLTDSMLLDSRFFTSVGPRELAYRMGLATTDLPITVMCHAESIEAAIHQKVDRGEEFRWQLMNDQPTSAPWPTPRIEAAWQEWVEAASRGDITIEPISANPRPGHPKSSIEIDYKPSPSEHEVAKEFATFAVEAGAQRSPVYDKHRELRANPELAEGARHDLDAAWQEWNRAYLDGLARQHDADWITVRPSRTDVRVAGKGRELVRLSGSLLDLAPTMPPGAFGSLVFRSQHARERFLEDRTQWRLHALAFQIDMAQYVPTRGAALTSMAAKLALAIAALILVSPLVTQTADRWLVAWTIFGAYVIATFPWAELISLARIRPRKMSAVLSVSST